jgi:hypothetical protein
MKMEQSIPKRRHLSYRRRWITQNKAYNNKYFILSYILFTTFPNLITVEFLLYIKSQFTTNAQNILQLNSHMDTSDHGMSPLFQRQLQMAWQY